MVPMHELLSSISLLSVPGSLQQRKRRVGTGQTCLDGVPQGLCTASRAMPALLGTILETFSHLLQFLQSRIPRLAGDDSSLTRTRINE
jgi:hypothetical protein